ncbi:oxidoreductase [Vibrio sp. CAIM 722]|uniref:Oxidoreductase n=3 Tax=Vibrionaceae TaxID=641 RepID=A0A7X4RSY8_9VIBR|nr:MULTISPECIES: aldo/keto reductase family oxidoreductase [Vibrio]MBF9003144.1 aldo/keto reductase family oxidoreductase [Vibrio nitrifigilis]MZI91868.1 oxidoreductase [Vibrio eleionomae]
MDKVTFTGQGPECSQLVQGYWRLAEWGMSAQERLTFIQQHVELGVSTVDHADIYGMHQCERLFGEALALKPELKQKIQIVTKCDINLTGSIFPQRKVKHYDTSAEHIIHSVENSLQALGVDKLDVLLIHRPDALLDADEVALCFERLQQQGKVVHFGVSNFTPSQFSLLQSRLDQPLVTNQVEINPLNFDVVHDGTLDQLQQLRVRPMAWSCLAGGELSRSSNNHLTERSKRVVDELYAVAQELGAKNIEQVIYAWIRRLPSNPIPILGSGKIARVNNAVDALKYELSREQWYRIWTASMGQEVP